MALNAVDSFYNTHISDLKEQKQDKKENVSIFENTRLGWDEIGEIALKSGGNFFKNMFCDEDGFSISRTAVTVGAVSLFTFALPAAVRLGAGKKVQAGIKIGLKTLATVLGIKMGVEGVSNIVKGTKAYYNSNSHDDSVFAMEQVMNGTVESVMSLPTFVSACKVMKFVKNLPETQSVDTKTLTKTFFKELATDSPTKLSVTRLTEELLVGEAGNTTKCFRNSDGFIHHIESYYNGALVSTEYRKYHDNGKINQRIVKATDGSVDKKIYDKKGKLRKEVYRDKGKVLFENRFERDKDGKLIRTVYEDKLQDKSQIIERDSCGRLLRVINLNNGSVQYKGYEYIEKADSTLIVKITTKDMDELGFDVTRTIVETFDNGVLIDLKEDINDSK